MEGLKRGHYDPKVVEDIYKSLDQAQFDASQVQNLEFNSYLERYLWPHYDMEASSSAHLMSIALLINQKVREGVSAWDAIATRKKDFPSFFERMLELWSHSTKAKPDANQPQSVGGAVHTLNLREKIIVVQFLINCFQSLEQDFVRTCCLKLTGLQSWFHLNELHREKLFAANKKLPAFWKKVQKKYAEPSTTSTKHERNFMSEMLDFALGAVESYGEQASIGEDDMTLLERTVELTIDLVDQLPTRRFFRPLLVDKHFVVRCRMSKVAQRSEARLFNQLLGILRYYENFEVDDTTGSPLSRREITDAHYDRLQLLQKVCFQEDSAGLRQIALSNVASLDTRDGMLLRFESLPLEVLKSLCRKVCYLDVGKDPTLSALENKVKAQVEAAEKAEAEAAEKDENNQDPNQPPKKKRKKKKKTSLPMTEEEKRLKELLLEILVSRLERPTMRQDDIAKLPLYPTEDLVWDPNLVPAEDYTGEYSLALPKLNLQFLTIHDYLLRNFNLFRLESTYEVRDNLHDQIPRMKPRLQHDGTTQMTGMARMCLPMVGLEITVVKRPKVGDVVPAEVLAEVKWSVAGLLPHVRSEWDMLREHDVIFLLHLDAPAEPFQGNVDSLPVSEVPGKFGIMALRGAEITELLDEQGNVISDPNPNERRSPVGDLRVARVMLDPAQYHMDLENAATGKNVEVYSRLNLIMRRKPKENNFKAILQTIRSLMDNEDTVVPDWLHDLFLGYGDPGAAQYWKLPTALNQFDFRDTFLDEDHILESFPEADDIRIPPDLRRPFRLQFEKVQNSQARAGDRPPEVVIASAYNLPNMGPYPECIPRVNNVRFTPTQVEAIRSGVNPGLTMVVGPPGTGKTDTAVQVVNLLFHNFPDQKIVLVAHSNQALNDLFEKIVALDIPERYLLRLGRGIDELDMKKDFSKWGRVNYMLQRRIDLLGKVERLAESIGEHGQDAAYTCENAEHFFLQHVMYRWEDFQRRLKIAGEDGAAIAKAMAKRAAVTSEQAKEEEEAEVKKAEEMLKSGARTVVSLLFPFGKFFSDAPQPLFPGGSYAADMDVADGCFRYFQNMFKEIKECMAFELLRNSHDRGDYLITTHARIIAMTCTHAALQRSNLVRLNFKYDNLIMEESAQILEVETFIPMLLQQSDRGVSRLKRVMLIGDHHQLPPVVKNRAFQKYGHLDQSLYARFVRLHTPTVDLNLQGRARKEIAELYSWRYKDLGNLPNVHMEEVFKAYNRGMTYPYQFINVDDFDGKGESQPQPHFFQNLGEAEYCVALFMYLRLMGYPAERISILSTYNGQKALLRDVVRQRCAWNPLFGEPSKITTVDRFQGQQNDIIIISLVRTQHVGHLRDVRRLIVAMSRSRIGMYVFGRFSLFENCFELAPVFSRFAKLPRNLSLELGETVDSPPRPLDAPGRPTLVRDLHHMWEVLQESMKAQFQAAAQLVSTTSPAVSTAVAVAAAMDSD
mmetsp:Transcript_299/g.1022  ORF Transcript_299/g.1022 Transcript_299/m.1022 type:complete len:1462 (+) Transcript_299:73-4458(+)